jgi:hypothetical protein
MSNEEDFCEILKEYQKVVLRIDELMNRAHALNMIREGTVLFKKQEGKYPKSLNSTVTTYLNNCNRQEELGEILGGD